ncbi:MAG: hydrolase [Alkaliphilus sp.]
MNELEGELLIQSGKDLYYPTVIEGVSWSTEIKRMPGKLTFKFVDDGAIDIKEGNAVRFKIDNQSIFYGFIFSMKRNKDKIVSVTAYDQLRYLKNKDIYVFENMKASDITKKLGADFKLNLGNIEDTGHIMASRIEDNKTLFDMIQNALDITLQNTTQMFVLFDDFGKLSIKNVENMKLDLVIGDETCESFSYDTSINESYNKIKLSFANEEAGHRDIFIAKDSGNMNEWGILQLFDTLEENENGKSKADALLKLHNRKRRTMSIKDALGDVRIRAGSVVTIFIEELDIKNLMIVEKATHNFKNDEHLMSLTVIAGDVGV